MTTLAKFMIIVGADNSPPMLEKSLYDSWKIRMELYMENRENGRMILDSVLNGLLVWPTVVQEGGTTRKKTYAELFAIEKIQAECDLKTTNIVLQGLPPDIFAQLINNMNLINMSMRQVQVNTKFLNSLPPEWNKFVTDVKLDRDLHTTNYDQLYSYLKQHEAHANETRLMLERYQDPLAFVANYNQLPSQLNNYHSQYNSTQFPQQTNNMISQVYSPPSYLPMYPPPHLSQPQITSTQPMTEFPQMDSDLAVPVFSQGDDPITYLNKAMALLTAVASSMFPSTNNQLSTSSNPRNQATIQDGRITVQQVQGRQGQSYVGTGYKGHMARQYTQPKRPRNAAWFKKKAMLAEAHESGQVLDKEQLTFLADLGIPNGQAAQTTILNNAAFQIGDLDSYDSDCDDVSNAKVVLMANLSNYGSDVISEGSHSKPYHNDMDNQKLSTEQAFWLQTSNPNTEQSDISPGRIEAHSELPKASLVNTSLKKIKFHLSNFDTVVKKQITPDAITEGEWGLEHTKAIFLKEIIPFLKTLKDTFNVFYRDLLNENVLLSVMNSTTLIGESVNLEMQRKYFKNNDLKTQLQAKDTIICKLKEHIKSIRENDKEEKVKQDMDEIETINIKLGHKHSDSLILQLNSKSVENADLKAQFQDKVFVITSLKNDLRKLKWKEIVENDAQIPIATTIAPGMFKLDLDPLASRFTPTKVVHLKETTSNSVEISKLEIKVYSRRPKQVKTIGSSKKAKIARSKIANNSEHNHTWGSNATDVPYSSSLVNDRLSRLFSDFFDLSTIKSLKTKSWLWHRRLSYLNFGTQNKLAKDGLARGIPKLKFKKDHLCSACALGKSKKSSHQPKAEDTNQEKLYLLHMDLCGLMRVESINGKKYILVIVDDYSRFT
ncbi:retrovirus-related pol polyprotein from transposon TNT 1-94 [Tanacetum coccineum]